MYKILSCNQPTMNYCSYRFSDKNVHDEQNLYPNYFIIEKTDNTYSDVNDLKIKLQNSLKNTPFVMLLF